MSKLLHVIFDTIKFDFSFTYKVMVTLDSCGPELRLCYKFWLRLHTNIHEHAATHNEMRCEFSKYKLFEKKICFSETDKY
jgi:hypothetical protein